MADHIEADKWKSESRSPTSDANLREILTDQSSTHLFTLNLPLRSPSSQQEQQATAHPVPPPATEPSTPSRPTLSVAIPEIDDEAETPSPPSSLFAQSPACPPPGPESPQELGAQHLPLSRSLLLLRTQPKYPFDPRKEQHDLLASRSDYFTADLLGSPETLNPSTDRRVAVDVDARPMWLNPVKETWQRVLKRKRVGHPDRGIDKREGPLEYLKGRFWEKP